MSRWALAAVAMVVVVGVAAMPHQAAPQIGYVSTELIIQRMPGFAQAESTFNVEIASYRQEVERLQAALDSASRAFDQQQVVLSPTARQERLQELQRMQQQYVNRQQELTERAQARRDELMRPLEDRAQRVIDGLRAERNLSVIFDIASPTNQLISADPALDLTQVVVNRLRGGQDR